MIKKSSLLGSFMVGLLFVGTALAQTTGGLRGQVKDPSGAVIPHARVTAYLEATNVPRATDTDQDGNYQFAVLPVGRYRVEIEAPGFKKYLQAGIDVTLGHVAVIDADLELGAVTEEVTTVAAAPLIETTSTELGAVMNDRAVVDLPLNARDTYQLLQLQPGVQSQVGAGLFYGSDQAGSVSVNGGRGRSNNFMVNGGDANDQFANLPGIQPSPDTIQEFRVLTNSFDAEFGRNSGSIVNVVTKSGTNQLHGDLYEFFRNKVLNARGFFDTTKPDFKQNQFGGTIGGPIKRDRTFFFGSYEARRIRQGTSSPVVTVPTAAERTGDFSAGSPFSGTLTDSNVANILNARGTCAADVAAAGGDPIAAGNPYGPVFDNNGNIVDPGIFPNNFIPPSCFDPTALDLMNQFVPSANVGLDQFQSVPTSSLRADQFTIKIDHAINDHQQLSGYYYFNDDSQFQPFSYFQAAGANVPGFGANFATRNQQAILTHTWVMNSTTVNEFRASFFREGQGKVNQPVNTALVQNSCKTVPAVQCFSDPNNPALGITPGLGSKYEGVPFISVSGGFAIGNNFEGQLPQFGNTFQLSDNFSKVMGSHTLKFGGDIRRQQFNQTLYFDVNGDYAYYGGGPNDVGYDNLYPNYLLGLPDSYVQGGAQLEAIRSSSFYLYAQDSWKISSNLNLNYGLRWELNTPLHDRFNRIQTFRPGQATSVYPCTLSADSAQALGVGTGPTDCNPGGPGESVFPLGLVVPGDKGIPPGLTQTYYKSLAPRIGIAWSPGSSGKTSIRAGFGVFYNPVEQLVLEQFSAEPPFGGSSAIANDLFNLPFEGQSGSVSPNPFSGIKNPTPGQPVDWSLFRPILLYGQFLPHQRSQYSEQYNFTIQRQIGPDVVVQVGYVGSQGHRLLVTHDLNYGNAQTCLDLQNISDILSASSDPNLQSEGASLACGSFYADSSFFIPAGTLPAGTTLHLPYGPVPSVTGPNATDINIVGLRPYSSPLCHPVGNTGCPADGIPVFSSIFAQDTMGNSNYHSLQVSAEKRFSKGLQFEAAYTWSKSFDYGSSFEDIVDPLNFHKSYSLSQFDARHRFVFSYVWQPPFPKLEGTAGKLVDGWAFSGITTFQSGFPIRITSSDDLELMYSYDFLTPGEPNMVAPFHKLDPRGPNHLAFDPASFSEPSQPTGVIGSSPRTVCCGPGIGNFDFALLKDTNLTERARVQFRAEFFNVFNHAQFVNPDANFSDGSDFGTVKNARDPRLIQFALKLLF
jgi:Carboxypeptidase regulatory-like domain